MRFLVLCLAFGISISGYASLDSYNGKFQNCEYSELNNLLQKAYKDVQVKMSGLTDTERESYFYKSTFESEMVTLFGSKYLPSNTRLSLGAKACGYYMDYYIESLLQKKRNEDYIVSWILCIESDFRKNAPQLANDIMNCYRLKNKN